MIILKGINFGHLQSVQVELPYANMVIDPRSNYFSRVGLFLRGRSLRSPGPRFRCEYHDNGTTVTLTRITNTDNFDLVYEMYSFSFRVYDPATETVPSFDSTIYTYMGVDDEMAPYDTTVLIIHPSVTVIKFKAFIACKKIEKCIMHDGVHTIEECAFLCCSAMKMIRLSQTLTSIGEHAFVQCLSLEAVFLPPSVNDIRAGAFGDCRNLRILRIPRSHNIYQIASGVHENCHRFLHNFIRHDRGSTLRMACLGTHVTHETIQQCIDTYGQVTASITDHDGMTPLHILAMNPHADISSLRACFDLNMSIAFVGDSRGNTPLDYLRVHHDSIDDHTSLVSSLCMHWYAAASNQGHQETNKKRKRSTDE